ncbi:MAG: hypothetical protein DRI36_00005 [Caldiserica bacterium]|nr:MAG: hypothetical protein DRI36_00005 [Caldisericota bacterium]
MKLKKFGYFSKDGTEFIITTPLPPKPWINYLTNEIYCAIISQTAGGYSFYKDCRSDRILRWAPENKNFDRPGRYIFVHDTDTKEIWSLSYIPLRQKYKRYLCRHGLGYTEIEQERGSILSKIEFFVPVNEPCEVWIVSLKNKGKKTKRLKLFPYVEFLIGDYHMELRYRNIMVLYNRSWFDREKGAIFAKKTAYWGDMNIQPFPYVVFFSSSLKVKKACTRKEAFLGPYNTEEMPESVFKGELREFNFCSGEDAVGAFQHDVKIDPGKVVKFAIVLGEAKSDTARRLIKKYRNISKAMEELERTKKWWRKLILDNIEIETPDKDINIFFNIWCKYQLYICNYWSRSPSYYHEGSGGRGYRDSCQDAESIVSLNPELTRKRIFSLAKLIREDGSTAPGWSETRGPATYRPNKDHPVWLVYTVSSYIKETGDVGILNKKLPYLKDKWKDGWEIDPLWSKGSIFLGKGTLYEHLWKNLEYTYNDFGEYKLPRIGHADWNDGIDAAGIKHRGGSVMLAFQLIRSMKILAELANLIGRKKDAEELMRRVEMVKNILENKYWDGVWYVRGVTDDGYVYGSKRNREGKIFLNSQSWAILSGVAQGERLKKLLFSVDKYLETKHGYALFYPAYSKWDKRLGRMSMFSEGTKENAAIFCHAAMFMIAANCIAGRGEKAYINLRKIMPNTQEDYNLYKAEPYVFAEYLVGREHPYLFGEGEFTWITGTAGWGFMVLNQYILGIKPEINGLRVSPCIPSHWKKVYIKRPFRADIYEIIIYNEHGVETGVEKIIVDGKEIRGNLIPYFGDKKRHTVEVIMGKRKGGQR